MNTTLPFCSGKDGVSVTANRSQGSPVRELGSGILRLAQGPLLSTAIHIRSIQYTCYIAFMLGRQEMVLTHVIISQYENVTYASRTSSSLAKVPTSQPIYDR
ncbi:hypothetical protein CHS0354_017676 [Potamilus streckersoni]|uniref:Uncharacterized protein n=1 Tax=Potamilus streckersoni TaxID=2493646 RepID=A0AAE0S8C5_9BIVA|nr:hypothetical protein CHS0354_017676 [Potamilus streckersoni]